MPVLQWHWNCLGTVINNSRWKVKEMMLTGAKTHYLYAIPNSNSRLRRALPPNKSYATGNSLWGNRPESRCEADCECGHLLPCPVAVINIADVRVQNKSL